MFQKRVPRASSIPRWKPDFENGWQGKPAARTSCGRHDHLRLGVGDDVAVGRHTPVALVDRGCFGVLLDGVDALAAEGAERCVEPANSGEQVDESKRRTVTLCHDTKAYQLGTT